MGYTFDPLLFSGLVPLSPGGGVPIIPVVGDLPASAPIGSLYIVAADGNLYEYRGLPDGWVIIAGPGVMLGIGPIDSETPSADGAVDANNALVLQSASSTVPGLVNNAVQSFSGDKTFDNNVEVAGDFLVDGDADLSSGQFTVSNNRVESQDDVIARQNKGFLLSPSADAANGLKGQIAWVPEDPYGLDFYGGPAPVIQMIAERTASGGAPHDLIISTTTAHPTLVERMRIVANGIVRIVSNLLDMNNNDVINVQHLGIQNPTPPSALSVGNEQAMYGGGATNEPVAVISGVGPSVDPQRGIFSVVDQSPMGAGVGGDITFMGSYTSADAKTFFAQIKGVKENGNDGEFGGELLLNSRPFGGGSTTQVVVRSNGTVDILNNALNMNTHQIHNVVDPSAPQDAATQNYVDNQDALKANIQLDNLSATAINASLLPDGDLAHDLGSPSLRWGSILGANLGIDGIYNSTAGGPGGVVQVFAAQLDMQGNKITNLVNPTAAQDAATKAYVDAHVPTGTANTSAFFNAAGNLSSSTNYKYNNTSQSLSVGANVNASGSHSFARGDNTSGATFQASGDGAMASGWTGSGTLEATGLGSHALGYANDGKLSSRGNGSFAAGAGYAGSGVPTVEAVGDASIALGYGIAGGVVSSQGGGSLAVGFSVNGGSNVVTSSASQGSISGGYVDSGSQISTTSNGSIALGHGTNGGSINSTAQGSVAAGHVNASQINASADGAIALGGTQSSGSLNASAIGAVTLGMSSGGGAMSASVDGAIALGRSEASMTSAGAGSVVTGYAAGGSMDASGPGAHAIGFTAGTMSSTGTGSIILGAANDGTMISSGIGSIAMGTGYAGPSGTPTVQSTANGSIAMGYAVSGGLLSASGDGAVASGASDGSGSTIVASGVGSKASGSVTSGDDVIAGGTGSVAHGRGITNNSMLAAYHGRYAVVSPSNPTSWVSTDPLFVLGNGSSAGSRNNAFMIHKDGTEFIKDPSLSGASVGYVRTLVDASTGEVAWQAGGTGGSFLLIPSDVTPDVNETRKLGAYGDQWLQTITKQLLSSGGPLDVYSGSIDGNPSASGYSVGVGADGNGLVLDANGGDAYLSTQVTTGVGISGTVRIQGGASDATSGSIVVKSGDGTGSDSATGTIDLLTGTSTGTALSGQINMHTGDANNAGTGQIDIRTGLAVTGNTGQIAIISGDATTSGNTGAVTLATGVSSGGIAGDLSLGTGGGSQSGNINIVTAAGSVSSGQISMSTGATTSGATGRIIMSTGPANGSDAGDFILQTGDAVSGGAGDFIVQTGNGSAGRGLIRLDDGSQAVGYVWTATDLSGNGHWAAAAVSTVTNNKELFVLSGTNITNQYLDLAHVAKTGSIDFLVRGGGVQIEGASYDYTVSYTGGAGGNTRITFVNGLATGGVSALVATDVVVVKYQY